MALADRPTRPTPAGPRCGIAVLMETMPADDLATLTAWLADKSIQGSTIARNLTAEGYEVKADKLRHHRKGDCSCGAR